MAVEAEASSWFNNISTSLCEFQPRIQDIQPVRRPLATMETDLTITNVDMTNFVTPWHKGFELQSSCNAMANGGATLAQMRGSSTELLSSWIQVLMILSSNLFLLQDQVVGAAIG